MSSYSNLRVGIVDDSPLVRRLIADAVEHTPGMEVAGEAGDPFEAREMIKAVNPDVITLDVEMPRMNGLEFLKKLMRLRPMPVIMVSTLTQNGAAITVQALSMGALDYVAKPDRFQTGVRDYNIFSDLLIPKLRAVRHANYSAQSRFKLARLPEENAAQKSLTPSAYAAIFIASSTGGVERLNYLISHLKLDMPPLVVVQHINKMYVPNMVERMNSIAPSHIQVQLAQHGQKLERNHIYFADNKAHIEVHPLGRGLQIKQLDAPALNGFIASADYLFFSASQLLKRRTLGLVLSGMGHDGAEGLLAMQKNGFETIGESEASCLVYGMPKAAQQLGALDQELSLERIATHLNTTIAGAKRR